MELLRPCLFFYLLAILLSLSISSTTNSDPTNAEAETLQWKGGDGVKRSRVRRQNLQHALRLPEKAYAFYMLWRLLNEMYNDTNTIDPLMMRPDKLEFTTSEGPKNMEIENRPSSAPIQEQSSHYTGMVSFPTETSLDPQKTTQLEDLQLVEQSTQRLQTTIQKITELNQAIEQHMPDSTFKIPTIAAEEPSTIVIHEQMDHFTGSNGTNNSTTMASFPTDSLPDSQETTQSGDLQLPEESTQHFQTTTQKITEPNEFREQHISDSITFKIPTISTEEQSTVTIHEQMDHFTGINGTNNSTAMVPFPTQSSLPDSQETTHSGDSQLPEEPTQRLPTTIQTITEPSEVTEQRFPDSTTFTIKVSSKAAEEPSSNTINEQMDRFTGVIGTNNSTAMPSFPTHSLPDSQEITHAGGPHLVEESTQRLQTSIQKITEPSEVTEQQILDSTTFTIKMSKAAEEPSSITKHEQMDHLIGVNGTNNSTAMPSFPTHSLPVSQEITHSGDPQLVEQSAESFQTTIQKITEPSQVIEQDNPDSTTFKIPTIVTEEPSIIAIHEQMDNFTSINGTNNSTAMASFPTHSSLPDSRETTHSDDAHLVEQSAERFQTTKEKITEPNQAIEQHIPDSTTFKIPTTAAEEPSTIAIHESFLTDSFNSQERTQPEDPKLAEESTQRLQTTIQKITEPNEVTEQHFPDSTKFTIKISKAAEEPSSITKHEQMDHFTGVNGINNSTAVTSFPSHVTEQHILDSTTFTIKISSKAAEESSSIAIYVQMDHFTGDNGTNNSTAMPSFPTLSLPDSQEITHSGDPEIVEQSAERFQTIKEKITEPNQAIEQHIPDSTTFKIPTIATEETSIIAIHDQMEDFTGINGTNKSTDMASFPTHSSLPDSQETTYSEAHLVEQSAECFQTTKEKITEPNQAIEQHIPDSSTFKIPTTAAEEPSTIAIHESFLTDSLNSQERTQPEDPKLAEESTQRLQTTIQKITEPSQAIEQHIPDSTTFKMPTIATEETSIIAIHDQMEDFTGINGTNKSTDMASFPTHSLPDSQETAHSGDPQLVEQSAENFQTTKQKISEPSQVVEQEIPDSTILKIPTIATEEPSTIAVHEQIDHFTGINDTNNSTAMASFPTDSLPDLQETTQSGDLQFSEESTQHFQTTIQKITEPNQVIEQHIPVSTTFKKPIIATEGPSTIAIHEQIDHLIGFTGTKNSTAVASFPTHSSLPDSPARTKQTTLSTVKPDVIKNPPHTLSVTWQKEKPNWLVTTTDWRVSKPTPPTFTLEHQILDSASPNSEPTNQHREKNTTNTAKSSRDSFMQQFMTNTHILTDALASSKIASTSPLPNLTENYLDDSKGPEDISVPTGISLQDSTSFVTQSNANTQSQRTKKSHTSFLLVKDTSTQAPTDGVRSSQTTPVSTEKLITMFTLNSKPAEKHTHTTSVTRRKFLTSTTQENPSWISTKRSNIQPTKTAEPRLDLTTQGPTADSMPKEISTNNDLLTKTDKPTQSMSGRKPSTTTTRWHLSKTQSFSRKPKRFIFPTHKSAITAIDDDKKTRSDIYGLLFTFGCLLLLIIVILLREVRRRWKAQQWRNNMWVAGSPVLLGTYNSVLQVSSSYTAIQMRKKDSQKKKQKNSDVHETIVLNQQHIDLV